MHFIPIIREPDISDQRFASIECLSALDMFDAFYSKIGYHPPWIGYFVIDREAVVGLGSFKGQPVNGSVEISYWTFDAYQGRGIGSFACGELLKIAKSAVSEVSVTAQTLPEENASTSILKNHGFSYKSVVQDEEIGDAWLWTL